MAQIDVEAESHWLVAGDSGQGLYDFYAMIIRAGGKVRYACEPERFVAATEPSNWWSPRPRTERSTV